MGHLSETGRMSSFPDTWFRRNHLKKEHIIAFSLAILTFAVYFQVLGHGFISLDDPDYVTANPAVQEGLSLHGIKWAFHMPGPGDYTYWHPITWLSHMLDVQFFGLNAGWHHISNVFFHGINVVLLFIALRMMTGRVWRSAFVAALFAVHPINVDSVAWIAERKNLLSTSFWMGSLIAYAWYARKPGISRYAPVAAAFILGLLAKPMLVTLPFVFLLLDYWPLGRIDRISLKGEGRIGEPKPGPSGVRHDSFTFLVVEKIPLLAISLVMIFISSLSFRRTGGSITTEMVPMALRIENAVVSYVQYLWKGIFPHDLTIFYPYPGSIPLWVLVFSICFLAVVIALAVKAVQRYPYFPVGWLWFLGTLVPVIGLVQGGLWPAIAERFAYVPLIGIFIVIAWGIPDILKRWKPGALPLAVSAATVLLILTALTIRQTGFWKDDFTLFTHALSVNENDFVAHLNLGAALTERGDIEGADAHFLSVLRINPRDVKAHYNLGLNLTRQGKIDEAIQHYKEVIRIDPGKLGPDVYNNLGALLVHTGRLDEAIDRFREAVRRYPQHGPSHNNLGIALQRGGQMGEAEKAFFMAIRIDPAYADARYNLGVLLLGQGRLREAIEQFRGVLKVDPGNANARHNLEKAMVQVKELDALVEDVQGRLSTRPTDPVLLSKLGELFGRSGDFREATRAYDAASRQKPDSVQILERLAYFSSAMGDYSRSLSALLRLRELKPGSPDVSYNIACVYARQNKVPEAVRWLEGAIEQGFENWNLLRRDPDLEGIRGTDTYKVLIGKHEALQGMSGRRF